jgi:hypothetical protein
MLRSLAGQVLVHYTIVAFVDPRDLDTELLIMKLWTCVAAGGRRGEQG